MALHSLSVLWTKKLVPLTDRGSHPLQEGKGFSVRADRGAESTGTKAQLFGVPLR